MEDSGSETYGHPGKRAQPDEGLRQTKPKLDPEQKVDGYALLLNLGRPASAKSGRLAAHG